MPGPRRRRAPDACRQLTGPAGPLPACGSQPGRLAAAAVEFGSALLVARTSGSLSVAGLTSGAHALGQVTRGPLVGPPEQPVRAAGAGAGPEGPQETAGRPVTAVFAVAGTAGSARLRPVPGDAADAVPRTGS
ncbi:hypothetical protein [Streptomyces sp. NPDC046759]|uniref:hypothetical protein n=1 Tax=Streptomyces sp. NPDC046759 TaxID=3155019 RepID=UPI0033F81605